MVYLPTLQIIYHTNQLNVGKYASPMDAIGSVDFFQSPSPFSKVFYFVFSRGEARK